MYTYIEERVLDVAHYIIENGATLRNAAGKFGISKSTMHKDMVERLADLNPALAVSVQRILKKNKEERHIRGGMATHLKFKGPEAK